MWWTAFADCLIRDGLLSDLTSIRVGGRARWLFQPATERELKELLLTLHGQGLSYRVLGGGSNLLAPDEGVTEVIIHPARLKGLQVEGERVEAQAGLALSSLVAEANRLGLAGPHQLSGIPGQVGGALVMNAGGRYGEMGSLVEKARVFLPDGSCQVLSKDELHFAYRESQLPAGAVVAAVTLKLKASEDPRALRRESGRILKEKNASQPTRSWNFGCMFKNPPDKSAGRLVQLAGLCGRRLGQARISPVHGNFIENLGQARAAEVVALMAEAARAVRETFGITLEREVHIWEG